MSYPKLSDTVCATGQISLDDLTSIKDAGFVAIINNRPDGEMPGQPQADTIAQAAEKLGLQYTHIPVTSPPFSDADITAFADALDGAGGPVLAHCRSGMRSTCLWALSQADKTPADELIAAAANAGFDISGLAPLLAARQSS